MKTLLMSGTSPGTYRTRRGYEQPLTIRRQYMVSKQKPVGR